MSRRRSARPGPAPRSRVAPARRGGAVGAASSARSRSAAWSAGATAWLGVARLSSARSSASSAGGARLSAARSATAIQVAGCGLAATAVSSGLPRVSASAPLSASAAPPARRRRAPRRVARGVVRSCRGVSASSARSSRRSCSFTYNRCVSNPWSSWRSSIRRAGERRDFVQAHLSGSFPLQLWLACPAWCELIMRCWCYSI